MDRQKIFVRTDVDKQEKKEEFGGQAAIYDK